MHLAPKSKSQSRTLLLATVPPGGPRLSLHVRLLPVLAVLVGHHARTQGERYYQFETKPRGRQIRRSPTLTSHPASQDGDFFNHSLLDGAAPTETGRSRLPYSQVSRRRISPRGSPGSHPSVAVPGPLEAAVVKESIQLARHGELGSLAAGGCAGYPSSAEEPSSSPAKSPISFLKNY